MGSSPGGSLSSKFSALKSGTAAASKDQVAGQAAPTAGTQSGTQAGAQSPANSAAGDKAGDKRDETKIVTACNITVEYGSIGLGVGSTVKVLGITGDQVLVRYGSLEGKIPVACTNLQKKN